MDIDKVFTPAARMSVKKTENCSSSLIYSQGNLEILSDLQQETLLRIWGVCPRPSTTVINMISAEMNLPKDIVLDFFVQRKIQDSTSHADNVSAVESFWPILYLVLIYVGI